MKINAFIKLFFLLFCLITNVYGQNTVNVYDKKNWINYFTTFKDGLFYDSYNNLKDSLPDGKYYFYSYEKKDSTSKKVPHIIIAGEYKNGIKNGKFEHSDFIYDKKKKTFLLRWYSVCYYKNGVKEGVEEKFDVLNWEISFAYVMYYYCEFKNGMKNGLEILFEHGYPYNISIYENDTIKETLMDRNIYNVTLPTHSKSKRY